MAQSAHILLKREFLNTRKMFTDKKNGLEPLKGDIVIICKDDPRLGLITEVISQHRVKVKFKNRGKNKEAIYHLKTLGLIFRPATSTHFMAIINKDHNQLNPLLSSLWDKLGSCLKHTNIEPPTALLSPSSSSWTLWSSSTCSCLAIPHRWAGAPNRGTANYNLKHLFNQ